MFVFGYRGFENLLEPDTLGPAAVSLKKPKCDKTCFCRVCWPFGDGGWNLTAHVLRTPKGKNQFALSRPGRRFALGVVIVYYAGRVLAVLLEDFF